MDEPKELATVPSETLDTTNLSLRQMSFIANEMASAKMFPDLANAHAAFVKILAGAAAGIGPFEAVTGIHIIQGKAVMGSGLMASRVKGSGKYNYRVLKQTDQVCEIEFFERTGNKEVSVGKSSFTIEDAKKAGTKNLDRFPKNMLFARAMSNGVKWYCPDIFGSTTVYAEGEIIEGEVVPEQTQTQVERETPETVETAAPEAAPEEPEATEADTNTVTPAQIRKMYAILKEKGVTDAEVANNIIHLTGGVQSKTELTKTSAAELIERLENTDPQAFEIFFGPQTEEAADEGPQE